MTRYLKTDLAHRRCRIYESKKILEGRVYKNIGVGVLAVRAVYRASLREILYVRKNTNELHDCDNNGRPRRHRRGQTDENIGIMADGIIIIIYRDNKI